ncbi:MAG: hypothetical protein HYZ17_10825 [Betaproteobacteria bacterium]|nr:hypothetical protein [Betaproteobacteria bacterium]
MAGRIFGLLLLAAVSIAPVAAADEATPMAGFILGRPCAEAGRVGECPLKWADAMVFRSMQGKIYDIDLAASGIKQERLDEAYGLEVELYGKVSVAGRESRVAIAQLNIVKPPGSREFFKG